MGRYIREGANALGGIPDVPHLDIGRGDREH